MWFFKRKNKIQPRYDYFDVVIDGDTGAIHSLYRGYNLAPWHESTGPKEFSCEAEQAPRLSGLRHWIEERGGEITDLGKHFGLPTADFPDAYLVYRCKSGEPTYGYLVRVPLPSL